MSPCESRIGVLNSHGAGKILVRILLKRPIYGIMMLFVLIMVCLQIVYIILLEKKIVLDQQPKSVQDLKRTITFFAGQIGL